jgi:hypothetical protein
MEFVRHLKPDKVLGIDMGNLSPFPNDWSEFPDAQVVNVQDLDERTLRDFFDGLDALWCAETPYHEEAFTIAREMGVRTYLTGNFEFLKWLRKPDLPAPDLFLAPSTWRLNEWPSPTKYLPFPVARDRLPFQLRTELRAFLHVAGHSAIHDRNGTLSTVLALQHLRVPCKVIIRSQEPLRQRIRHPKYVEVDVQVSNAKDYWTLYEDADCLVIPRRYGGLSLPMNEAASKGLAIIASGIEPQSEWLPSESTVGTRIRGRFNAPGALIQLHEVHPRALAMKMDEFSSDPGMLERCSKTSGEYADAISWDRLLPQYRAVLCSTP